MPQKNMEVVSTTPKKKKKINSKQKGSRVERYVVTWLKEEQGFESARRSEQYCGKGGTSDIFCEELSEFHIEVKGTASTTLKKSQLLKWYDQIERDCPSDKFPVIFNKANDKDIVAIIRADDLYTLIHKHGNLLMVTPTIGTAIVITDSINPTKLFDEFSATFKIKHKYSWLHPEITYRDRVIFNILFETSTDKVFVFLRGLEFIEIAKKYMSRMSVKMV